MSWILWTGIVGLGIGLAVHAYENAMDAWDRHKKRHQRCYLAERESDDGTKP